MSQMLQTINERQISLLIQPRDIKVLKQPTGNLYEAIVAIGKRANQINEKITNEIREQIECFSTQADTFDEVQENQEQIAVSRLYEKLPSPCLVAMDEFIKEEIIFGSANQSTLKKP